MGNGGTHPVPLLRLGFRPFYLLAGLFAVFAVPAWMAVYFGLLDSPSSMPTLFWHAHEMLFGFAAAVIAGFLLTAVPNWTGRPTPTGWGLAMLALLWLLGRLFLWFDDVLATPFNITLDTAFLFLLAAVLARPIWQSRNLRNFGIVGIVLIIALANLLFHLVITGRVGASLLAVLNTGLDAIILIMVIIGGRVIPFFTANALPEAGARRHALADRLSIASVLCLLVADAVAPATPAVALLAVLAAVVNGWRMLFWAPLVTLKRPILWILNVGYAWIVIGLLLKGIAPGLEWIPRQAAVHAITVGAIGSLTLGMMTRTALGHSGRPLVLPGPVVWSYVFVNAAALIRVAGTFGSVELLRSSLIVSTLAWSAAYALFLIVYWPILTLARVDGRPG